MLTIFRRTLAVVLVTILWLGPAAAEVPRSINYQGYLTTSTGLPVDATLILTLRLYADEMGGVPLWQETQMGVVVSNGVFNVELGKFNPIPLPFGGIYYLAVEVNGDGEMAPRRALNSAPYALRSSTTDSIPAVTCPAGMTKIEQPSSTLCYHAGTTGTWDSASQFCSQSFAAPLCTLVQWRDAVCSAGVPNPGNSWTATPAGTASFATVAGCTGDGVGVSAYNVQRPGPCCLQWMKY